MAIDIHAHYIPSQVIEALAKHPERFPNVRLIRLEDGRVRFQFPREPVTRPVPPLLLDLEQRLRWMEENGITSQIVGGWTDIFGYTLPPHEGAAWSRLLNEAMAEALSPLHPRLWGLATVPLQDGELAARELEAAHRLGLKGVMIGSWVDGKELHDPSLEPFWACASELKMPVVIHPVYAGGEERLSKFGLPSLINIIARPYETLLAAFSIIYGGVLEKFPKLKLVLVHGGGYLPYQIGRLQHGFTLDAQYLPNIKLTPIEAIGRFFFDHILFHPHSLKFLCELAGTDKVLLGSDYPFPVGDLKPTRILEILPMNPEEIQAISHENARKLFGI